MFDVGFWELVMVGVVALLAFGPQELPRLVRDTARIMRKLRLAAHAAGDELKRELHLDDLDSPHGPYTPPRPIREVVDEVRQIGADIRREARIDTEQPDRQDKAD